MCCQCLSIRKDLKLPISGRVNSTAIHKLLMLEQTSIFLLPLISFLRSTLILTQSHFPLSLSLSLSVKSQPTVN